MYGDDEVVNTVKARNAKSMFFRNCILWMYLSVSKTCILRRFALASYTRQNVRIHDEFNDIKVDVFTCIHVARFYFGTSVKYLVLEFYKEDWKL